jgi:hypothetical protein
MFSTPINTLEDRAVFIALLARLHGVPEAVRLHDYPDTLQPSRDIVMVRGNHVCRRRSVPALELVGAAGPPMEAGRGWRRGAAWDETDASSIFERLSAAAVAGGLDVLGADHEVEHEEPVLI